MKALAVYLKTAHKGAFDLFGMGSRKDISENSWEIVGLLHDGDYERTKDRPVEHGPIVLDEIRSLGFKLTPEEAEAIKFHNFENTHAKESLLGWAIHTCEAATGLIVAVVLARDDKKLASVTHEALMEKMTDTSFAKSVKRETINQSKEKLGLETKEFLRICLEAMKGIAQELGL